MRLGEPLGLGGGCLSVDAEGLVRALRDAEPRIHAVDVELATSGASARVLCVKDVVEPRHKSSGTERGSGCLHVLRGVAVATCGPIVGFQEGIIDMSGPGARHTPFSALHLVVLRIEVVAGTGPHDHEGIVRAAGLRAAALLAGAAAGAGQPDRTETIALDAPPVSAGLPRVAYVYMVLSQGLLHDTYVDGRHAREGLPRIVDPRFVIDDGLVSGNCVSACDKNTSYHHQNNPMIRALLDRHGRELEFAGVVLTNASTRLAEKQHAAAAAVDLVIGLEADAAVITKEGFGNPDADLMMLIRGLERRGVRTVAVTDEFAGADGASESLADGTAEADAIVSTGNANARIELPTMDRVIGPPSHVERLAGSSAGAARADGTIEVELQVIMGSTNQLGFGRLTCREM